MIAALRGVLSGLDLRSDGAAECTIDVGGVGYEVIVAAKCAASHGSIGEPIELAIYTHMREGAITLYGFATRQERRTFILLISAHGIGPALALAILGVLPPDSLARAVESGDVDALVEVPGVGRKTAQRLIIDLAARLDDVVGGASRTIEAVAADHSQTEVRAALGALGYGPEEVRAALERLPREGTVEELLRVALRELAPSR